ncbi:MAG TPA: molybdopterin molybdotransferase MoeA [Accumulibacter sp.]|mgnify:CR=1 FL=1|uniref:Molybdopterin molybdenumtransferase n=2 Tax=Candidatus Accumulibacter TaxID=327159 RepID=A0A080MKT4_9PROT|nr:MULTISPECIES: gephyrin-like molybdotransferase Glp [Candidatus Accumulibacter]KFB78099.1 MAG: Molybdopterin molybdenumtransferase [Candidatus Accumulibacter cognatus]MBL8400882.1 molybdopterin molybdotransferase MoeA [Accumulibacter sp.]MBN8516337.1 molybdopterin molybdotransferase MoeA [Accumulibacter sp.]MBO3711994.1 molybdopterin molybdotransferase MoeA [Accumulibacter sp.]MCC2867130.1 molybdopterin molybdotransferase MoeA [Candidatus Accumulibacter phosphatis]
MPLTARFSCFNDYDPDALSVEQARTFIRSQLTPLQTQERLALRSALGRILASDVIAPANVPAHDNSAMDGYALRHADLSSSGETRLRVAGTALAGQAFAGSMATGECVRIMTGAPLPVGSDVVVMQEVVEVAGDRVVIPPGQRCGQNIRRAGEDLAAGQAALTAGRLIRPAELGLIASLGCAEVSVYRRLRVAFFSTGDELCSIGTPLGCGEVYDSNRYTLFGMLRRMGCEIFDLGVVGDDPMLLDATFRQAAAAADVVISSGGVSVGEADFVKPLMTQLGEVLFWKIAMKPGRPMAFGRITAAGVGGEEGASAWLFGLPGNPVAVMVTFYAFVRDALYLLMGADPLPVVPLLPAWCSVALKKSPGRTEYQRGILSHAQGQWCVRPTGAQGSGILRSMSEANCFIVLEQDRGSVAAGETVSVQVFDGLV